MNTQLIVEPRDKYGEMRIYPKCEKSKLFCQMLNQKSRSGNRLAHSSPDELPKLQH